MAMAPYTHGGDQVLLSTGVAGNVRGPLGQHLLLAEPRYAPAASAPPREVGACAGLGDITAWAGYALRATAPPATPFFSPHLVPAPTLPPPPEHQPGELCAKRGIRPPPGLTELAERDEPAINPPPGLGLARECDSSDDLKGDADASSTTASSRAASASLLSGLGDSP